MTRFCHECSSEIHGEATTFRNHLFCSISCIYAWVASIGIRNRAAVEYAGSPSGRRGTVGTPSLGIGGGLVVLLNSPQA